MTTAKIKTNIKFNQGLGEQKGRFYGFVSKVNGAWRGCREDFNGKKKIVIPMEHLCSKLVENALYQCVLIPMENDKGFFASHVQLMKFPALIDSICRDGEFMVVLRFGHKKVVYNPASNDTQINNIQKLAGKIKRRIDLENPLQVAEDFVSSCCLMKKLYEQHSEYLKNNSK